MSSLNKIRLADPPALNAVALSPTSNLCTWPQIFDAASYKLYRGATLVYSGSNLSFTDTGVTGGTTYSYTVRSVSALGGDGKASAPASVTTPGGTGRVWTPGTIVAIAPNQRVANGIPNAGSISSTGPACTNVKGFLTRRDWGNELEHVAAGQFDVSGIKKELADCASFTPKMKLWVMIVGRTFTGKSAALNPAPPGAKNLADTFDDQANPALSGWQIRWWDPTIVERFDALMVGTAKALIGDPNLDCLAGFATQETATGTPPTVAGYDAATFCNALKSMSDSISSAFMDKRHMFLFNTLSGTNDAQFTTLMSDVLDHILDNDAVLAFSDLVMKTGSKLNTRNALLVKAYHDGTISTTGHAGGATMGSIQRPEWLGITPADARSIPQLFGYGTGQIADDNGNKYYRLDGLIPDWHTGSGRPNFAQDAAPVIASAAYAAPYGTYVP